MNLNCCPCIVIALFIQLLCSDVNPTLFQCWACVCDAGATLKQHWVNISPLLGDTGATGNVRLVCYPFVLLRLNCEWLCIIIHNLLKRICSLFLSSHLIINVKSYSPDKLFSYADKCKDECDVTSMY